MSVHLTRYRGCYRGPGTHKIRLGRFNLWRQWRAR